MKLPIHLHCGENIDAVEARWRKSIRKDFGIKRNIQSIGLLFYTHLSGTVGVMYEAQFRAHASDYEVALAALGLTLKKSIRVPTIHATLRRAV